MTANAIVVVGAAIGGLDPLRRITEALPRNCGASIFIVMHGSYPGVLPEILGWHGSLPIVIGRDGALIEAGHIYVAPQDHHMLVEIDRIRLNQGPKIHSVRPAADLLFASAAETHGKRVIGIVLSGAGSDGAIGLETIKQHGGCALVEDPRDATSPSMPAAAIAADSPECLRIEDLARHVSDFCLRVDTDERAERHVKAAKPASVGK
jgi:two-component system chemotaxis response regulator CheB